MTRTAALSIALAIVGGARARGRSTRSREAARGGRCGRPLGDRIRVQVTRECPDREVEPQVTLAARGILPLPDTGTDLLTMEGPFQQVLYRAQSEAASDSRRHPDFCSRLAAITGARWPRLARVLRSSGSPRP